MNFRKVNNITGWVVCAIACLVYVLTAEATGSFWDTGEFIASAHKLQNPHPPGAPLFTLLGRFFIVLFGSSNPAYAVNLLSAISSGFTILFLFWSITHFARKMVTESVAEPTMGQTFTIIAAGLVGALAYTFSDSFWFSAVEGEVYALSSFFTALVFWAMLKWERADDLAGNNALAQARADRWIVFIFFMMGLSIGVHLLNLLTIPALVMIYYFKRYKPTLSGSIWAFLIGCAITGIVQVPVIQWTIKLAGQFDILAVNTFGLPFFTGFIFLFLLLAVGVYFGLRYAQRKGNFFLRLGLWAFVFMMVGYSMYATSLIRSNANPAIDMNNVDNPMSLVYYLGREQYGSAPLLYGPHFQAEYERTSDGQVATEDGAMNYTKGADKYIPIGHTKEPIYKSGDKQLFVRVWDASNEQGHADFYADWLGLEQEQKETGGMGYEAPSYGDNMHWFFSYQMSHMYWRYFMWNFAGKQNDIQGYGNKRDGNWITGIAPLDNDRLGNQSLMPESIRKNEANNAFYLLPFLLGMLGLVYQYFRNRNDWIVTFLLFFITGIGVVLYLNQPGNQPRERDYAYVGSFYAFAIWIGLSVVAMVCMAAAGLKDETVRKTIIWGSAATLVLSALINVSGGSFLNTVATPLLFAAFTAGATLLVRAAGKTVLIATTIALIIGLIAPILMAKDGWDDHDRSQKTLAPSQARNYLNSCAPNAILFTFGDNDTYPLWYAQEVEGVRPDIRIINTSLLGIDWYVNQLRYKVNESAPIDAIWTPEQVSGVKYIVFNPQGRQDTARSLQGMMTEIGAQLSAQEDRSLIEQNVGFPTKRFSMPLDPALLTQYGVMNATDTVAGANFEFSLPEGKNYLTLDQLTLLNVIAANGWKRPIYFTNAYGELGFGQYLRKDGLTFRLVPLKVAQQGANWVIDQLMGGRSSLGAVNLPAMKANVEKFTAGGAEADKKIYFDEENRRHLLAIRGAFAEVAGNLADAGDKAGALAMLAKGEATVRPQALPYAMVSRYSSHNQAALVYLEAALKAGDAALAKRISDALKKDIGEQRAYHQHLRERGLIKDEAATQEESMNDVMERLMAEIERYYATPRPQLPAQAPPPAPAQPTQQP